MAEQEYTTVFPQLSESSWLLEIDGFDPALEPTIEAVCALVNGYSGTRAAIEEGSAVSRPATFIAGVFNTPAQPQTAELDEPISEIVVAPNWSRLRIAVEGQSLSLDQAELLEQRRVLDLRQGILLREWRVRDGADRITSLRSLRFASLDDRHTLVQLLTLTPENYSGRITLESLLDVRMDHVMLIDFEGFIQLTDDLDGVTVTNKTAFTSHGHDYPRGKISIQGAKALWFVRERHSLPRGDLDRAENQRKVLKAIVQKGLSAGVVADPADRKSVV